MKHQIIRDISLQGVISKKYALTINPTTSIKKIISDGHYREVNPLIETATKKWGYQRAHLWSYDAYLVQIKEPNVSQLEVNQALIEVSGLRCATPFELLHFGARHRSECARKWIISPIPLKLSDHDAYLQTAKTFGHKPTKKGERDWIRYEKHRMFWLSAINGFRRGRELEIIYGYPRLLNHTCWDYDCWFLALKFR